MPRPLKRGILGASTIILSKDIDKYAFMCGSNFYESDVIKSCHIYRKDRNDGFIFDFLDQICQKWIKLDQTFWPETAFWQ